MNKIFTFAVIAIMIISCKTQELYLNVVEPAPVTLPPEARSAGIADRSEAARGARALDAIDKVITLEGAELDRAGAEESLKGLSEVLSENQRFEKVIIIPEKFPAVKFPGTFPPPLEWPEAERICRENEVDLLFTLESFDTDTRINYQIVKNGNSRSLLGVIIGTEHRADMQTLVKTAWRIYFPAGRQILDEFPLIHSLNFSASGLTPVIAAAALIDRKEAVKKTGLRAGRIYGERIIPYEITVERKYYVRGSEKFRTAMRKARTGNWDEAAELWKAETTSHRKKIAGRACYNMAVAAEIKGNLELAADWAEKAYEDYNLRKALKYLRIIENRMRKDELVQIQEQN